MEYQTTPLAWSPLGGGTLTWTLEKAQAENQNLANLLTKLDAIASEQGVSRTAVALASIHVSSFGIIPIIGTQTPSRIRDLGMPWKLNSPDHNGMKSWLPHRAIHFHRARKKSQRHSKKTR